MMRSMAAVLTVAVAVALLTVVGKVDGACLGGELNECITGVGEGSASSSCCSEINDLINRDRSCFCSLMKEDSNMGGFLKKKLSNCNINDNSVCSTGSAESVLKSSYTALGFTIFIWIVLLVSKMEGKDHMSSPTTDEVAYSNEL